jgi:hypothetical protein
MVISKKIYQLIIDTEITLLHKFKIDPFTLEKNLTILDFQVYSKLLIDRVQEDIKRMEKSGNSISGILSILLSKLT